MYIAYCSDIPEFANNKLRDEQWSRRFPGSGWITCLHRFGLEYGIEVASGDVAISNICSLRWNAKDVLVIQELNAADGAKLLNYGAIPFIITAFEAPLYAPFFYDNVRRYTASFMLRMGYGFATLPGSSDGDCHDAFQLRFPSYYFDDLKEIPPFQGRKKIVLVAANKYKTKHLFFQEKFSLYGFLRLSKSIVWRVISPTYRKALSASLHDWRLEAIDYFARKGDLDLFGSGWDKYDSLPSHWISRLRNIIGKSYLGRCDNKLLVISKYRFSICFENMIWPGYVTEKIIDCFVAGTIPIYLGAPDVEIFVPSGSFVDMRAFSSFDQLDSYISSISEDDALRMLLAGRDFLRTKIGMLHSYEGFARNVLTLADKSLRV